MIVTYRLNVYVTQPVSANPEDPDFPLLQEATAATWKREIERSIAKTLRRHELACDVELIDYTVEEEA